MKLKELPETNSKRVTLSSIHAGQTIVRSIPISHIDSVVESFSSFIVTYRRTRGSGNVWYVPKTPENTEALKGLVK